jgi:hypothetical protein
VDMSDPSISSNSSSCRSEKAEDGLLGEVDVEAGLDISIWKYSRGI